MVCNEIVFSQRVYKITSVTSGYAVSRLHSRGLERCKKSFLSFKAHWAALISVS